MPFKMKCWIPVEMEPEEIIIYANSLDAQIDLKQATMMQPENKYEIVECDKAGNELD